MENFTEDEMNPNEAYKKIIDNLVSEVLPSGYGRFVAEKGIFSAAPDHKEYNQFIETLSSEQRILLSKMLLEERDNTIHDVLAELSWWIDCEDVGLTLNGKPMPIDQSGMGLHGDYVGRRQDWDWPEEE